MLSWVVIVTRVTQTSWLANQTFKEIAIMQLIIVEEVEEELTIAGLQITSAEPSFLIMHRGLIRTSRAQ